MARVRLGVALLVPPPVDREIDGLRRALGDGALGRIPAHITLVPPVNVSVDQLGDALAVVRGAAAGTRPLKVELGQPATFLPDNPVIYLPVVTGVEGVTRLRDRVFRPPLARDLSWPFVPHVTIADDATPERIGAARSALRDYRAEVVFERVHVLQESAGRIWEPIADAELAAPAVVGRGGLPLELSRTEQPDPQALALLAAGHRRVTITARRDGVVVGVLNGLGDGDDGRVTELTLAAGEEPLGTGDHLRAAFESWSAATAPE